MNPSEELSAMGYEQVFDYTQYSHKKHVNAIPEEDFKRLIRDTFATIAEMMRSTYGPYGSTMMISDQNETTSTKDGFHVFEAMGFSHAYKHKVYLAIKKICERVNQNVGDGTTSCILLADKMFTALEKCIHTPDDKRMILDVLSWIEQSLQDPAHMELDKADELIHPLNKLALDGLISVAGNYDKELTRVIVNAMDPEYEKSENNDDVVKSIRNVVVEAKLDPNGVSGTTYEIDHLPGDYRVRVHMDQEVALLFEDPRRIRVALYDHTFNDSDWNFLMEKFDKETETLIMARGFDRTFADNAYVRYCKQRAVANAPVKLILCEIKGGYFKDEVDDLAAVLNTTAIGRHAKAVVHEELPVVDISIHKGNCMCFHGVKSPTKYVELLKAERDADLSDSLVRKTNYLNRIRALSFEAKDTMITVRSGTSLELKMIRDKIDDCVSIVESACQYGIVPNMLVYGYYRVDYLKDITRDELYTNVLDALLESIRGLFYDIWESKHSDKYPEKKAAICNDLYQRGFSSFDIIKEGFLPIENLPTSAQYDIEVIVAAISIVKYLLTSRGLIFDAHMMTPVNDVGRYQLINE